MVEKFEVLPCYNIELMKNYFEVSPCFYFVILNGIFLYIFGIE